MRSRRCATSDLLRRSGIWLAALWWGSLATIGALVVPLLFAHLPSPALAGAMAARLFAAQTWVSLGCGLGLLLAARRQLPTRAAAAEPLVRLLTLGAMLLALLLEFAVAPRILARENLALWHALGSAMYVLQCLCALLLFARLSARARAAQP